MDKLIVLRPIDFKYSYKWRLDAEKRMGKGMTDDQIHDFVSYFIESIDPYVYYGQLYKTRPKNLAMEFTIDEAHKIVDFKYFD